MRQCGLPMTGDFLSCSQTCVGTGIVVLKEHVSHVDIYQGVILIDFMAKGTTINSEAYIETLRKLKTRLKRCRPNVYLIITMT